MDVRRLRHTFIELAKRFQAELGRSEGLQPGPITGSILIRGELVLLDELADAYFSALEALSPKANEDSPYSKESIDSALTDALRQLAESSGPSERARRSATDLFIAELTKPSSTYLARISVFGLDPGCDGLAFGRLAFSRETFTLRVSVAGFIEGVPRPVTTASLEVEGADKLSAQKRAERIVDQHLAVLNAFCSDPYPSHIDLTRFSSNMHRVNLYAVSAKDEEPDDLHGTSFLGARTFSRQEFESKLSLKAATRLSELITTHTSLADRVISSLATAGAACTEAVPQQAFLLFAIALESVILGGERQSELSSQLAIRTALLLGGTLASRRRIRDTVRNLYDLRSRIVHSGESSVALAEVGRLRSLTLSTIFKLATHADFAVMQDSAQLDAWFIDQMLGASA